MQCSLTKAGKVRALLFRIIDVTMTLDEWGRRRGVFRVLPAVLVSPSLANYLPSDLSEFADVFRPDENRNFSVEKLRFGGPGSLAYDQNCDLELLRAAH